MSTWDKILQNKKLMSILSSVIFALATALFGAVLLGGLSKEPVKININSDSGNGISGSLSTQLKPAGSEEKENEPKKEENKKITVHIKGQVSKPGIVILDEGQRLYEAIELVGGTLETADLNSINLAKPLKDGDSIYIPSKGEINQNTLLEGNISGKININTASKEQLSNLPGIGDSIANDIIQYRKSNNGFNSIEELMNVTGIGEKKFDKIKDLIEIR